MCQQHIACDIELVFSLMLFQMFPQLHTCWTHGLCFATAAEHVCDTSSHLSSEPGGTARCPALPVPHAY